MNRFLSLCILSLVAVFALGACTSTPAPPPSTSVGDGTPSGDSTPATAPGQVIPLDLSFEDPQLGDQITIAGFVPIFDLSSTSKEKYSTELDGGTIALVDVRGTTGGQYYSPIQDGRFRLVCDEKILAPQTNSFAADMTAAGFAPFPDDGIQAGGSGDYWIAFMVGGNPNPTDCSLAYTRTAAKELGTDNDIPVYTTTVQLN